MLFKKCYRLPPKPPTNLSLVPELERPYVPPISLAEGPKNFPLAVPERLLDEAPVAVTAPEITFVPAA